MAATGTPTPNLGLRIPVGTDPASVDDINYNSNLLDTVLGAVGNISVKDQLDELSDQIASLPSTLKSSYNTLVDVVQITQNATNYTLYGNRKFSDYNLLYITPMVESYFRPGCVIPRSSFAGNGNGTSFTCPSGGIDVEVVIKYVSDTQVSMKYNASSTRDVRIYLGAYKLE